MGTIVVRPTDTLEVIKQKVAQATSGDTVKFSAGEYPDVLLSDLECTDGVTLRTDGAMLTGEPGEKKEEEEAEEPSELEDEGEGEGEDEGEEVPGEKQGLTEEDPLPEQ